MDLHILTADAGVETDVDTVTSRVATASYRLLARGHAVEPRQVGAFAGLPLEQVEQVLEACGDTRRDHDGRVVAFGGLDLEPTPHRMIVRGTELATWCAWDTLFIPLILQAEATVESRAPDGTTVGGGRPRHQAGQCRGGRTPGQAPRRHGDG